jgi:hypothetical protein
MPENKWELKPIDLKNAEEGLPIALNLDEDAWEFGPPPPKGAYRMKIFLARDGWKGSQQSEDPKDVYYQANLECRIVSDDDYNGIPVFTRVDTRLYRGKDISTMAGLLTAIGAKAVLAKEANSITPLRLSKYLEAALKKEPIGTGEVDWRGSYMFLNQKGEETWANPLRKYEDFPMLEDGKGRHHIHTITDKVTGAGYEVRAQAYVSRWFGKDDHIPTYDARGIVKELKGVPAVPQLVKPVTLAPQPAQAIMASPALVSAPRSAPRPAAPVPSDADDLNLMLET